jgi:hypothetical protein
MKKLSAGNDVSLTRLITSVGPLVLLVVGASAALNQPSAALNQPSAALNQPTQASEPQHPTAPTRPYPLDAQSTTGPVPPTGVDVAGGLVTSTTITVTIPGVPAYVWHHGCGPTAAGMVIGYWDSHGFDGLVAGKTVTQTAAVNEMIASEGPASNYSDYCEPIDSYPDLFPDRSEPPPGDEHSDECLADFTKTSQSAYSNRYGWSWFSDIDRGLENYTHQVMASLGASSSAENLRMSNGTLNWEIFQAEMDAGRPMVLLIDTDSDGKTDHFVTAVGYGLIQDVPHYACHNTWDHNVHWFEFAPLAEGQSWGLFGGVSFQIEGFDHHVFCPLTMRSP